MDLKLKNKWVRALRSGNYQQGTQALCDLEGGRFCCLGVLVDIQGHEWVEDCTGGGLVPVRPGTSRRIIKNTSEKLPRTITGGIDRLVQADLIDLNDGANWKGTRQRSFSEIADYIEENL